MKNKEKNIVKNSLGYDTGLYIYQDKNMFNYSVDTILLANYLSLSNKTKKVLEIGTNNAALSIFLASRKKDIFIEAIEIQEEAIDLANKNVELNNLVNQIKIIHSDFNEYWKLFDKSNANKYDAIICNPPFYKGDNVIKRLNNNLLDVALYDDKLNFDQIFEGASKIIKIKGNIALVIPTTRLVDIVCSMRKYGFEPKRIKMIFPRINTQSNLVLIEARYKSGWGTQFEKNLYLHNENNNDHNYTEEVLKLYKPIKFEN